jgi:hypothetical protein
VWVVKQFREETIVRYQLILLGCLMLLLGSATAAQNMAPLPPPPPPIIHVTVPPLKVEPIPIHDFKTLRTDLVAALPPPPEKLEEHIAHPHHVCHWEHFKGLYWTDEHGERHVLSEPRNEYVCE